MTHGMAARPVDRERSSWFQAEMLRIACFLTLLFLATFYALRKGGGPERTMAYILIAMLASDQALHLIVPARFTVLDAGHLAIDLAAATATLVLALRAHRFWPLAAAALQILPLLAHFSRVVDLSMHPIAYLSMQVFASWLLPPLLALATWRHRKRLQICGSDRSWRGSWPWSNPSMPKR
ncbi:hypothetical protein [Sphingopyxis chilensis]|uniref:hypothetical protein n=1 Tax=Sphingopyxis chilensis TaxID=180400 RepID=UPI002DDD3CAA|nr:hypothetical protein [Sphingopyxis chilensis]